MSKPTLLPFGSSKPKRDSNQNAGASLIWATPFATETVEIFDSSTVVAIMSSIPNSTFVGKSIVVHQDNHLGYQFLAQPIHPLLFPLVILQAIVAFTTPLSSVASRLQTNLSPLLYWVESQKMSSMTGGLFAHIVRSN
ncbi:MAG: hypothetical protein CM15mP9_3310 [Methanobacteriota archaeon]|nr:MAG: hypothetical protein CM15mP9_3310 [Euryarchaeota archaeon]